MLSSDRSKCSAHGATLGDLWPSSWPLLVFFSIALAIAVARFRKRLD